VRSRYASRAGKYLQENLKLDPGTAEVVSYGAEVALLGVLGLASILAVAALLGCVPETLAVVLVLFLMRSTAGGAHCANPVSCNIAGAVIIPLLGKVSAVWGSRLVSVESLLVIGVIVLGMVLWLAPVDNPNKPIRTRRHRRRLKLIAVLFIGVAVAAQLIMLGYSQEYLSMVAAVSCALAWGGLILTQLGWRVMALFDRLSQAFGVSG